MLGLNEEQAKEKAAKEGFALGKSLGHFRANSTAVAENEADGIAKVLFNRDSHEILGGAYHWHGESYCERCDHDGKMDFTCCFVALRVF